MSERETRSKADVQILKRREISARECQKKRVRAAVYCRVSTDLESQESSLAMQKSAFQKQIQDREGWELVGIYADEGLSGTQALGRDAFNRMIQDCQRGNIDYILTKSISRFARNTLECLSYVRSLKEMGVFIYFEKEKLDTGHAASEMVLSILAAVAQEESRSISENIKWGQRKRFAEGIPKWSPTYGYKKEHGANFLIDDLTAPVVRRIFQEYIAGSSLPQIVRSLEKDQIPSPNKSRWSPKVLAEMLANEKYVGDALLQKSCTIDHLTHKRVRNDQTEVPSYYIRDHHPPIVDRKTFETVQIIRSIKDRHKGFIQYPYYRRLRCPYCGSYLIRSTLPARGRPGVWHCLFEAGKPECKRYYLYEAYIDRALRDAYRSLDLRLLRSIAASLHASGPAASAAAAALSTKEQMPEIGKVEYGLLDTLVKEIAFPRWECMMIFWKWELSSSIQLHFQKNRDFPGHPEQQAAAQWLKEVRRTDPDEPPFDPNSHRRPYYYGKNSIIRDSLSPSVSANGEEPEDHKSQSL